MRFESMDFMRRNDDKIVGRAILYDPAMHTAHALPAMMSPKWNWKMSLAVGDGLYVMEMAPHPDVRRQRRSAAAFFRGARPQRTRRVVDDEYYWRPLPPPPYAHAAGYRYSVRDICAYAAAGESHILLSSESHGCAYSFDTASAVWSKAGDWTLPFSGRAEHVPEHGLWLGFSAMDDGVLGAWDLSSSTTSPQQEPPVASLQSKRFSVASRRGDRKGLPAPELLGSHVVHLGDGKLCVAKLFSVVRRGTCSCPCCVGEQDKMKFAMLTGVEVARGRIVKHKSCRYSFGEYIPTHVL